MSSKTTVSNEEAELYDRQIRLWGLEAQSKVRDAKVLIVGLRGVHTEVRAFFNFFVLRNSKRTIDRCAKILFLPESV